MNLLDKESKNNKQKTFGGGRVGRWGLENIREQLF